VGLPYDRHARAAGEPQYNFRRLLKLAIDGIFSFSTAPLRFVTRLGFFISALAMTGTMFSLAQRVFADAFARIGLRPVPGFATIVISLLFLGGIQLICLGVIGEYIGRIYEQVKQRPLWIVRETCGLDSDGAEQGRAKILPFSAPTEEDERRSPRRAA
jgi:dolichol-phosphate mannosyltransferase